ncbi:transmembrane protein, putative [Medicago truncatula]|uniref:Transmembrane protein, putative n=1 Tax=Medicago truncatula TaxID=3880 RepID=A0A072TM57_MEDTR|nr:transmembrane protein, putative [Medicago truncatula]
MSARAYSSCTSLLLTVASFGLGYYSVFIDRIAQFNRELSLVLNRFNRKTIVEFVLVGSLGPVLIEPGRKLNQGRRKGKSDGGVVVMPIPWGGPTPLSCLHLQRSGPEYKIERVAGL